MANNKVQLPGQKARELLEKYPDASLHSLAEKAFTENPLLFTNKEHARSALKYHSGKMGDASRKNNPMGKIEHKTDFTPKNPFGLPGSDAKPPEIYRLPKANNNILALFDIHVPYHDMQALSLAIQYGIEHKVNTVFLGGDIMDCYQASFHEKDPSKRSMKDEIAATAELLQAIQRALPLAKIFYKEGNHEMRWERYLRNKAPVVLDMQEFRLEVLLKLREMGIEFIRNSTLVKMGDLNAMHGNEYKGGGGINVARTLYLRAGENVIAGDKHKTQTGINTTVSKKVYGAWSVGCLCELNPEYMPFNQWNHGFAHIILDKDGNFEVHNKQIINGKVL